MNDGLLTRIFLTSKANRVNIDEMSDVLPDYILEIFDKNLSEEVLSALMPALGKYLQCDRCFLYLRNPRARVGKVPFCWTRNNTILDVSGTKWAEEPENLVISDPMFAAAVRAEPSIYIDDVETASSEVLSQEFEKKSFGHRALIHAHLCCKNELWGVLQPCVFSHPRYWTQTEQLAIEKIVQVITPIAIKYVQEVTQY